MINRTFSGQSISILQQTHRRQYMGQNYQLIGNKCYKSSVTIIHIISLLEINNSKKLIIESIQTTILKYSVPQPKQDSQQ
jgi:hypothetical protein